MSESREITEDNREEATLLEKGYPAPPDQDR